MPGRRAEHEEGVDIPWAVPSLRLRDKNGRRSDHRRAWWRTLVSYRKTLELAGRVFTPMVLLMVLWRRVKKLPDGSGIYSCGYMLDGGPDWSSRVNMVSLSSRTKESTENTYRRFDENFIRPASIGRPPSNTWINRTEQVLVPTYEFMQLSRQEQIKEYL